MKTIHHSRLVMAFTLPEVTLAIGVVALGLVAVFSILPFGLTAQKDNREETIIRYEAQIWREFLLAGGLMMDDLERVDRVELHEPLDLNGSRDPKKAPKFSHVFYNPYRGVPDNQNAGHTLLGYRLEHGTGAKAWYSYKVKSLDKELSPSPLDKARSFWPTDVSGWLLAPVEDAAFREDGNWGNFALMKAINGSLFDRFYGAEPGTTKFYFPNREFAMGYILQVQPEVLPNGSRVKLTFHWPIFEEVSTALQNGELLKDIVASSRTGGALLKSGVTIPRFQSQEFSMHSEGTLVPCLPESSLTLQERRVLKELRDVAVGEGIDLERLKLRLQPYKSKRHRFQSNSRERRFVNDHIGEYWIEVANGISWTKLSEYGDRKRDLSFFSDQSFYDPKFTSYPLGHSGFWLRSAGSEPLQIAWISPGPDSEDPNDPRLKPVFGVGDSVRGPYSLVLDSNQLPYSEKVGRGNAGPYELHSLGPVAPQSGNETWEELLDKLTKETATRPPLLRRSGDRFELARHLRLTTHRPASQDERALNQARATGLPLFQAWERVPDEVGAPGLWEIVR